VLCILCSALFALQIRNFGVRALVQISKCTDYLSDDARTTGSGEHELRSNSGCGTIVPLRTGCD
jgi:hypothetical protein